MKKTTKLLFGLIAPLLLVGCGDSKDPTKPATPSAQTSSVQPGTPTPSGEPTPSGTPTPSAKKFKIGIDQLVTHPALDAATQGFIDAVKEGLGEDNVEFDLQNAAGDAILCSTISNKFVSQNVDLIMANATPALQAAANSFSSYIGPKIVGLIKSCSILPFQSQWRL